MSSAVFLTLTLVTVVPPRARSDLGSTPGIAATRASDGTRTRNVQPLQLAVTDDLDESTQSALKQTE